MSVGFLAPLFVRRLAKGLELRVELLIHEPRPGRRAAWLEQKVYALKCDNREEMERRLRACEVLNRFLLREAPI